MPSVQVIETKVVGVSKKNTDGSSRQDIIKDSIVEGSEIRLEPEPDNPHDPDAIKVMTMSSLQIGYLSREVAPTVKSAIDHDTNVIAKVRWVSGHEIQGVGLRVELVN